MSPRHSIDFCPACGGGLCGIRLIDAVAVADDGMDQSPAEAPHGLIVCDECEAIWLEPDLTKTPVYVDPETPASPINGRPIWGDQSRWATLDDIEQLGWTRAVNHDLDVPDEEQTGGDP